MYTKVHLFYAAQPDELERQVEEFINQDIPSLNTAREMKTIQIVTYARDTALYNSRYAATILYPDIM